MANERYRARRDHRCGNNNFSKCNGDCGHCMATALDEMNKLTEGMDEGALTEYLSVLTQIQALLDSGMTQEQVSALFPEIDFTTQMDQMAALTQFVTEHQGIANRQGLFDWGGCL